MEVSAGGTQLAKYKNDDLVKLERPSTWGDLHMLIGLFELYSQFLPLYELDIIPWRYIFVKVASTSDTISEGGDGTN